MQNAAAFKATYSDWKLIKGRKVVQVIFEIPLERSAEAFAALGGMPNPAAEVWCAIARLVQPAERTVVPDRLERPSSSDNTQPASTSPPGRAPGKKLAQLAGMLSKTPLFHRYLEAMRLMPEFDSIGEDQATDYVRNYCGVKSRSEIIPGTRAAEKFRRLDNAFVSWCDADQYVEAS